MNEQSGVRMIDCQEAERRLHRYVDRELSDAEMVVVRQHLDACENCRARFRFEASLRLLVRTAAQNEPTPRGLRERIQHLRRRGTEG